MARPLPTLSEKIREAELLRDALEDAATEEITQNGPTPRFLELTMSYHRVAATVGYRPEREVAGTR